MAEARELLGSIPSEGLTRLVGMLIETRTAALCRERHWVTKDGEEHSHPDPDDRTALQALLAVIRLLGFRRELSDAARDAASRSPEERVAAALRDPIHGPLIAAAIRRGETHATQEGQ